MSKEQLTLNRRFAGNKRKCTDCLHCKVSAMSTGNSRLCFCVEIGRIAVINEIYWRNKTPCHKFNDMAG